MGSLAAARPATRDVTVNIRAKRHDLELIDRAAQALGRNRSGFIMEHAIKAAEAVLLDQRVFVLDDERYGRFVALLDQSPSDNPRLRDLLRTTPPWER